MMAVKWTLGLEQLVTKIPRFSEKREKFLLDIENFAHIFNVDLKTINVLNQMSVIVNNEQQFEQERD